MPGGRAIGGGGLFGQGPLEVDLPVHEGRLGAEDEAAGVRTDDRGREEKDIKPDAGGEEVRQIGGVLQDGDRQGVVHGEARSVVAVEG